MMSFFCLVNRFDVEGGDVGGGLKIVVKAVGSNGGNSGGGGDCRLRDIFLKITSVTGTTTATTVTSIFIIIIIIITTSKGIISQSI